MKICFYKELLTRRGTEIALFDYAYYNQKLLNNESIILTKHISNDYSEIDVYGKFEKEFKVIYYNNISEIDNILEQENIDYLYTICYGCEHRPITNKIPCLIHSVFDTRLPYGYRYAGVGNTLNDVYNNNVSVIPHIVRVEDCDEDLREELRIPSDAIVFGRYGGEETFDLEYVKNSVIELSKNKNIYFVFLFTKRFCEGIDNIIFLDGTSDMIIKRKFINTCDAMIHARGDGETFGIACGEFSICDKPVICNYIEKGKFRNHIDILGSDAITYKNEIEFKEIINSFEKNKYDVTNNGYKKYTPEYVMGEFQRIFLS